MKRAHDRKELAERLCMIRKHYRLSQTETANLLGLAAPSNISTIEKSHRTIDLDTLCSLADLFNVPTDWLLGRAPYEDRDFPFTSEDFLVYIAQMVGKLQNLDSHDNA